MEPQILLTPLRAHLVISHEVGSPVVDPTLQNEWLGRAAALINQWNSYHASDFRFAAGFLDTPILRDSNRAKLFRKIHEAISDLELKIPNNAE